MKDNSRIKKYFVNRIKYPSWTKSKCRDMAGYSKNTNVTALEENPDFKRLMTEYQAKKQDFLREKDERIREAMAAFDVSARDLLERLSNIVHDKEEESKYVISASKQITEITQDKNVEKQELAIPGVEAVLEKIFID